MRVFLIVFWLVFTAVNLNGIEWSAQQKGIPRGRVDRMRISSAILKNKRDVWIYTPAGYLKNQRPYPLLMIFDGQAYVSNLIPAPTILDNLIANQYIAPVVAVFVSSIDQASRNRELPCEESFVEFLAQELLPCIHQYYHVTHDPAQTTVTGSSYGGLAAAYAGLMHPEIFGNVLSQSGSFYWKDQWIIHRFEAASKLPLRFYLDVGDQENELVAINRYLFDVLKTKGYPIFYAEFPGGHEYKCWKAAFPIGLLALLGSRK
jgi:enterochelin esterase family protein